MDVSTHVLAPGLERLSGFRIRYCATLHITANSAVLNTTFLTTQGTIEQCTDEPITFRTCLFQNMSLGTGNFIYMSLSYQDS